MSDSKFRCPCGCQIEARSLYEFVYKMNTGDWDQADEIMRRDKCYLHGAEICVDGKWIPWNGLESKEPR